MQKTILVCNICYVQRSHAVVLAALNELTPALWAAYHPPRLLYTFKTWSAPTSVSSVAAAVEIITVRDRLLSRLMGQGGQGRFMWYTVVLF